MSTINPIDASQTDFTFRGHKRLRLVVAGFALANTHPAEVSTDG